MTSWKNLVALAICMVAACAEKQPDGDDLETASRSALTAVIYTYDEAMPCSSQQRILLEFRGDDLKDAIFASISSRPKEQFAPASACRSLSSAGSPRSMRLRLLREDGSIDILASPDLGCGNAASPDLTGIIPLDLQTEINDALTLKDFGTVDYQKNRIAAYFGGERVTGADIKSFEILPDAYARDKTRIYFEGKVLEGADGDSFVALRGNWAKDLRHAYYKAAVIDGADVQTLTVYAQKSDYALDSRQVYYQGRPIAGFDPQNFACMGRHYCRNTSQVIYKDNIVVQVDAGSFAVDSCEYDYSKGSAATLCTVGPSPSRLICKVHDANGAYVLEHDNRQNLQTRP